MENNEVSGTLSTEQLKELQALCGDMLSEADKVVEDYDTNPSKEPESGSITYVIHEDSPFLDERWEGEQWKHVANSTSAAEELLSKLPDEKKEKDAD